MDNPTYNFLSGTYVDGWDRKGISAVVDMAGNRLFWGDAIKNGPPCTIIHGTDDDINKISDSEILVDQLTKSNIKCELNPIESEDHYFANSTNTIDRIIAKFLYGNTVKTATYFSFKLGAESYSLNFIQPFIIFI